MDHLVSVVIPAFNSAAYIGAAIESVESQRYCPIEIIVVDDGSTDNTKTVVRGFGDVRYLRQVNSGPAKARNLGIKAAKGELVAFLDADDLWMPGKLTAQLNILEKQPDAAFVFGDMQEFGGSENTELSMYEKYCLGESFFGREFRVEQPVVKLLRFNFIPTGTVVARRQCLTAVGMFDETLRVVEDWDLWLRVALRFPLAYIRDVVMLRRVHEENTSKDTETMSLAHLQVLEKLKRENQDLLSKLGIDILTTMRDGYRNLGYFYLRRIALPEAREALRRSLLLGLRPRTLGYFLSTFLGRGFVDAVVRARG